MLQLNQRTRIEICRVSCLAKPKTIGKELHSKRNKSWRVGVKIIKFDDNPDYKLNICNQRFNHSKKKWVSFGARSSICINQKHWKELFSKNGLVFKCLGDFSVDTRTIRKKD